MTSDAEHDPTAPDLPEETRPPRRARERDVPPSAEEAIRQIVRSEVRDAQREDREYLARLAGAGTRLAAAAIAVAIGVGCLALMAVYVVGTLTEPWVGAAIVGAIIVLLSLGIARTAWRRFNDALEERRLQ